MDDEMKAKQDSDNVNNRGDVILMKVYAPLDNYIHDIFHYCACVCVSDCVCICVCKEKKLIIWHGADTSRLKLVA